MDEPSIETGTNDRQVTMQHLTCRLHALLLGGIDMQDVLETAEYPLVLRGVSCLTV